MIKTSRATAEDSSFTKQYDKLKKFDNEYAFTARQVRLRPVPRPRGKSMR
jgi:hypothetical protein